MAGFTDRIHQAKRNLLFLSAVNKHSGSYLDWQVTVCFYTALHLVNAHLSKYNLQYRKHFDVNNALNPLMPLSISKLPVNEYKAYIALQHLSRRSRYLISEKDNNISNTQAFFTYDKHLCKSIRHLDKLLLFFDSTYNLNITVMPFKCDGLDSAERLNYFNLQ